MTSSDPSFSTLETWLLNPPCDGVLLTYVDPDSQFALAGLAKGIVVLTVDEAPVRDWTGFGRALLPREGARADRAVLTQSLDGIRRVVRLTAGPTAWFGVPAASGCAVRAGEPGWEVLEDSDDAPDLKGLEDGAQIYLRANFGTTPAGFEALRLRHQDEHLLADLLVRLAQDAPDGGWDFRARLSTTHLLKRGLPAVRTRYHEGLPESERLRGDMHLEDGSWKGTRVGADDRLHEATVPQPCVWSSVGYTAYLQALTMPQREGALLTYAVLAEGSGVVTRRQRLVCLGRSEVKVDGRDVPVWTYELRHYGAYGERERFHLTSDRRVARIDWGANYGGCWAEAVPRERLLDGVPERVRFA